MGKCNCTPLVIENHAVHKINCSTMTAQPDTIDNELDQILSYLLSRIPPDSENYDKALEAKTAITNLIAQEANKARLETMQKVSDKLDGLHQGTEGAGWVHYGEMGEWLDDEISRLTADKGGARVLPHKKGNIPTITDDLDIEE